MCNYDCFFRITIIWIKFDATIIANSDLILRSIRHRLIYIIINHFTNYYRAK